MGILNFIRNIRDESFELPPYRVKVSRKYYQITYSILSKNLVRRNLTYRFYLYSGRLDDYRVKGDIAKQWNVNIEDIRIHDMIKGEE